MNKEKQTLVIIVSAPSGCGKTTIVNKLLEKMPDIKRSISCTTRAPREGEEKDKDYIFISEEEFKKKTKEDAFLEWEENFGRSYGTLAEQITRARRENRDIVLSIDVKGARKVKKKIPESISIFIMPPSVEELQARLKGRKTDDSAQLELRIKEAKKEIEASDEYDYLIVNEDLSEAVDELCSIIKEEKENRKGQKKREE